MIEFGNNYHENTLMNPLAIPIVLLMCYLQKVIASQALSILYFLTRRQNLVGVSDHCTRHCLIVSISSSLLIMETLHQA